MNIQLPPLTNGATPVPLPEFRQMTIVGANGSGKTRFTQRLMQACGDKAFPLSAQEAFFSDRPANTSTSPIDILYNRATERSPYLKADHVSEFDKLMFLLLNDECLYLLSHKSSQLFGNDPGPLLPTKLDAMINLWQRIFPENQILRHQGTLLFSTPSGDDKVSVLKLSKGEKAALYYIAATLYAPQEAVVFIDYPTMYLHPAILNSFWNAVESLRPDCTFIYNTYDVDFVTTRTEGIGVWVRAFDAANATWDYEILNPGPLNDDLLMQMTGARRPVLFIEGDATHSLDAKLYTLVFAEFTVKPLGSCDKVIESTRSFSDLSALHHLKSAGIVDRDRRTEKEVQYLRRKNIMVPEVAEIENLFLLEDVIKIMALKRGHKPEKVFGKVRDTIMRLWSSQLSSQALQHVRHRMKRLVECRIDGRFHNIRELEHHISELPAILNPGQQYNQLLAQFRKLKEENDYAGVLRVFNHKPMLAACGVDRLLGFSNVNAYIASILSTLKAGGKYGLQLSQAFRRAVN